MPITQKEADRLNAKKAEVKAAWAKACESVGLPAETKFVVFSNSNELAKEHNRLMGEFFKLRKNIKRNMARREREGVYRDLGLKRVIGAVSGRTYYE